MTHAMNSLDPDSVRKVSSTLKATPLAEVPDELFQQIMEAKKDMLELEYTELPSTSNNPTYKDYATIVVNGKVVAHIDNHGWLMTSNAMGGAFDAAIKEADSKTNPVSGPALAKVRAETIAAYMGGTVVMAPTAIDQRTYDANPQPTATIRVTAMENDPRYQELEQLRAAHAIFLAQQSVE